MAVYSEGQNLGSLFGFPLSVKLTTTNQKVIMQTITARDGKPGYVFRGRAVMLAANPASTKVSGFVDAHADQFLASDAQTGFTEPASLVFNDLEFSYNETTPSATTRIWQRKEDITGTAISNALSESGIMGTATRSASLTSQIGDFVSKNLVVILIVAGILLFVWANSGKKGKKSKGLFGF
jgi:hypothetical protein